MKYRIVYLNLDYTEAFVTRPFRPYYLNRILKNEGWPRRLIRLRRVVER